MQYARSFKKTIALGLLPFLLSACAKGLSAKPIAENVSLSLGCKSFEDDFWDSLYDVVSRNEQLPTPEEISHELESKLSSDRFKNLNAREKREFQEEITGLYRLLAESALEGVAKDDREARLERLTALELGDRTDETRARLQDAIRSRLAAIDANSANSQVECGKPEQPSQTGSTSDQAQTPTTPSTPTPEASTAVAKSWLAQVEKTRVPAVFGAWKTMATAYQSCSAVDLTALTSATNPVQGISIVGTHATGGGKKRAISNLAAVLRTHPYLQSYQHLGTTCVDSRKSPLIYDYGGKPYASSADDSRLNFFRNSGTGTSALGSDCSGFVYTSLATAGLKVKKSGRLKAIAVYGISARMMMEPSSNGLTCLNHVALAKAAAITPGDIIATTGHVIMVDTVGTDPLGLSHITSASQCTAAYLDSKNFNFSIVQSSPSLGGVGINRMRVADYLETSSTMKIGLEAYAVEACRAKFGLKPKAKVSGLSVVRHMTTDASCLDRRVALEKEECLASCAVTR